MKATDITLVYGKALLLRGGPGSGKSTLAKELAAKYGSFEELGIAQATSEMLSGILSREPNVVIFEDFTGKVKELSYIKTLTVSSKVKVKLPYKDTIVVKTPHFILCSNSGPALRLKKSDRRFIILDLPLKGDTNEGN